MSVTYEKGLDLLEVWPGNTEVREAEDMVLLETWLLWGVDSLEVLIFLNVLENPEQYQLEEREKWEFRKSFQNGNDQVLTHLNKYK